MISLKIVARLVYALITISSITTSALAEKVLCDAAVLGHPACEVGDFDNTHHSITIINSEIPILRTNRAAITEATRYLKVNKYERAIGILKEAITADPFDMFCPSALADAHVQYGDDLRRGKDLKRAIEQYRLALKAFLPCAEARQRLKEMNVSL